MESKDVQKRKIFTNEENSRLNLYGGCFDLVTGTSLSSKISEELKFAALFYERIIVPDGFFHCYGALSNYFTSYIKNRKGLEKELGKEANNIAKFLKAGILVPALRKGESLYENWKSGENIGIVPGEYLILNREHGDRILGYIAIIEWMRYTRKKGGQKNK
ncbi:MAG: hypothetical protein J7647_07370 [Cyanobacteria bacterium SBLK]|nr:hypothetical protein [Cyanobacteria bacterium SBLK]